MKVIGHRGARGLAPENTIASFRKALEHDVDAIEFDVRITKDNVAILTHDAKLSDPAGNKLKVNAHTYDELKAHNPDMPTLAEAIAFVNRAVPLIVELKPGEPTQPVIRVIREYLAKGWQAEDLLFVSFNFPILKQLHKAFPAHTIIVDETWSSIRAAYRAYRLDTKHISLYAPFVWSGFIKVVSRQGYVLYAFPLNDPSKAIRWKKSGFYGAITDFPDRFEK